MSDIGRTPKINGNGGRDHWTYCSRTSSPARGFAGSRSTACRDKQAAYVKDSNSSEVAGAPLRSITCVAARPPAGGSRP